MEPPSFSFIISGEKHPHPLKIQIYIENFDVEMSCFQGRILHSVVFQLH